MYISLSCYVNNDLVVFPLNKHIVITKSNKVLQNEENNIALRSSRVTRF